MFTGTTVVRIADDKIAERWANVDELGLLQQLGVVPPPHLRDSGCPCPGSPSTAAREQGLRRRRCGGVERPTRTGTSRCPSGKVKSKGRSLPMSIGTPLTEAEVRQFVSQMVS